jgi:hypothetical protein
MTDCHLIADRMPEVANGKTFWRASESAHLASCPDCSLEWDLIRVAQGLGAGVVASLDTSRIAERVARRMTEAGPAMPPRVLGPATRWLIGLAAAAALVLAVRPWRLGDSVTNLSNPVAAVSVLNELDDLTPLELESVLEALPTAAEAVPHVETAPFGDLEPQDLERVLRSLEG